MNQNFDLNYGNKIKLKRIIFETKYSLQEMNLKLTV